MNTPTIPPVASLTKPAYCPLCQRPIPAATAESIAFVAAQHGTNPALCLRCALDEVEAGEPLAYLDLPALVGERPRLSAEQELLHLAPPVPVQRCTPLRRGGGGADPRLHRRQRPPSYACQGVWL